MGILGGIFSSVVYMIPNHHPFFEPHYLTMTPIDQWVPFVPWTVWIYCSEYFLIYSAYLISSNDHNYNRFLYAFLTLQTFSSFIFCIYPTTFPRELFPLVADGSLTTRFFEGLRVTDAPTNCFPSLHVSSVYLSSFIFIKEKRKLFPIYFIWASLIGLSTLTTKQHYLADVIAGLGLAYGFYWLFHSKKFEYYVPKWLGPIKETKY